MKFYSDAQNQIVIKDGKIIAQFITGEFETQDNEKIKILKQGGYNHDQENCEEQAETIGYHEKNDDAGKGRKKGVHKRK